MKSGGLQEKLKRTGLAGLLIRAFILWFIFVFIIYPNISILVGIVYKDGNFSLTVFRKLLSSERAMKSLRNSLVLAVSLVVTVNIVGIALVIFTEYLDIKGAKIIRLGYLSTLVYGGIVLCTGYRYIYGEQGIITHLIMRFIPDLNPTWFQGYFAVLYIMTFACTSNHIIFLSNAIRGIDYQTVEAAKNMGASFKTIFFKVVLPVLKPTLFALTILTFLTGLGAVSAPLIVGGPDFQTINPMIITFSGTRYSRDIAALLAIILGVVTITLLAFLNRIERQGYYISISKVKSKIRKEKLRNPPANILAHSAAYILFLIYIGPIALVILYSFTDSVTILSGKFSPSSLSVENYLKLFSSVDAIKPYLISIVYSSLAAILVAMLTTQVCRIIHRSTTKFAGFLEYSMLIPWLLPTTLIGMSMLMAFDRRSPLVANQILVGTPVILLIGYIIIKIPFSLRMIKAAFFSVEDALEESARSMGAAPFYRFRRVVLPVILPAVASVVVLNFNSLLADYDLTVFLFNPFLIPLGPVIRAASDESSTLNAKAMSFVYSVVLMIISSAALYFVYGHKPRIHFHKGGLDGRQ
jgi:iron(III) transport system permease protein